MALLPPCPVSLGDLVLDACASGRLHHLSLSRLPDGRFQASLKRPDTNGYKIRVSNTAQGALEHVLGPDYGHDWDEVLTGRIEDSFDEDDLI